MWRQMLLLLLSGLFTCAQSFPQAVAETASRHTARETGLFANLTSCTIDTGHIGGRTPLYAQLLTDRVYNRARVRWLLGAPSPGGGITSVVTIEVANRGPADGYRIEASTSSVRIIGFDERGVLFGVGRLLRLLNSSFHEDYGSDRRDGPMSSVLLPLRTDGFLNITSLPDYPMRGHQLGYRPKTNAYDGWDAEQYERYIIDLALFGTNLIEFIPWSTDDVLFSPMFTLGPKDMLARTTAACDKWGLDVGLWYPMKYKDYHDPDTLHQAQAEWTELLGLLARLDEVQIPAGDPGSHSPADLMHATALWAQAMRHKFPNARLWLGPQEWSPSEMEQWWKVANNRNASACLDGLVYGPHTAVTLVEFVQRAPDWPLRLYPDITHSLTTQFPVPKWDRALAMTESRETINPRPHQYGHIAASHLSQLGRKGVGFSSYSEGANDDVNKFIWSALGWGADVVDGQAESVESAAAPTLAPNSTQLRTFVQQTVLEYANVLISSTNAVQLSNVIFGLEAAWVGPLLRNTEVNATLMAVRRLQQQSTQAAARDMADNWRWQQLQYRAMYDSFIQLRLIRETAAENQALDLLRAGLAAESEDATGGPDKFLTAINSARDLLRNASIPSSALPEESLLAVGVEVLAGRLFESISMQLSVPQYFAEYTVRGANLDTLRLPLTNAPYLLERLSVAASEPTEPGQRDIVASLTQWNDPGPGGFYDDLGDPEQSPHLVTPVSWAADPDYYTNPSEDRSLVKDQHWSKLHQAAPLMLPLLPVAWQTTVNTFYQAPLKLRYEGLEPAANYSVEVVYTVPSIYAADRLRAGTRSTPKPLVALAANGIPVHPPMLPPAVQERTKFPIPPVALQPPRATTVLELVWTMPPDVGGSGTGNFVAEVMVRRSLAMISSAST